MGTARRYHCSDGELITVSKTILNHAVENKETIITKKPAWKDPYFQNLQTGLDTVDEKYLGVDSAKSLRGATAALHAVIKPAVGDLTDFNTNLNVDYKKDSARKNEILNNLGFNKYYKKAVHNNQEELSSLLKQFKKNLTVELEAEIIEKGMNPDLITSIKGYADSFEASNVSQETAKGSRPELTAEGINACNGIYDEIAGVCEVGQNTFKKDKLKKDLFSFAKTLAALRGGNSGGGSDNGGDQTPPPK